MPGYASVLPKSSGYARYVKWINSLIFQEDIFVNRFVESPVAHPSVMFEKALVQQYGAYREGNFPEDYELWLRWMHKGVKFGKVNRPLLLWNDHPKRLSRKDARYASFSFYKIKAFYLAAWLKEKNIREVAIWGGGKQSAKRAFLLENYDIKIAHFKPMGIMFLGQLI